MSDSPSDPPEPQASSSQIQRTALTWSDYRLLIDRVEDYAIFLLDPGGFIASWNRGAERIKGYKPEEIIGKHFTVFYPPDDIAADKPGEELRVARARGHVEDEGWRLRKDGSRFWASVSITALRDDTNRLKGFAKVTRDLTERRRVEDELRRSEERFRLLVENVVDYAIYVLDPTGIVTTWNSGAEKIKGYRASEIIGRHFEVFFLAEDRAEGRPQRELGIAASEGRYDEEGWRVRKDGSRFWAHVVVTALRSGGGQLIGFAKVTRDLTARRAAEETARELVRQQTARALAEQTEERLREERERYRALSRRLEVILEGVADGITVQDRSGKVLFANTAAAQLSGFNSADELIEADPALLLDRFEILDESGKAFDLTELPGRRVLRGEPAAAALLCVRARDSGRRWWSSVRANAVPGADGEPELAVNILHDVSADRRRDEHRRYLHEVTATLSWSLDYRATLERLVRLLVPGLSDWCTIHLLDGDELRAVAVAHRDPEKATAAHEYDQKCGPGENGLWDVVQSAAPRLVPDIPKALRATHAEDSGYLEALRAAGMKSLLAVPIRARERVIGTLCLMTAESARRFDDEDSTLVEELGRRLGVFIENANLYEAEKRAREQLELLARAGEAFSGSLDFEETLRSVLQLTLPALGDFVILDVTQTDVPSRLSAAPDDPALAELLAKTPWPALDPEHRILGAADEMGFHPQLDDELRSQREGLAELEFLRQLQPRSLITVPLRARGRLLGSLSAGFKSSARRHSRSDLNLAEELGRRASMALVQALLYEEAQTAARRAEEAGRIKDEFLATVSHELRTPLNAIVGWSFLLRTRNTDPELVKGLDVIHRNAQAQSKIIEDILDVSRIVTGKLRLELKSADLNTIVHDAIEVIRPSATAKGLSVGFERPPEPCLLVVDPERIQQVLWNLLSNAVKFSEGGGEVRIQLRHERDQIVVSVADSGKGIEPEFLPYVFDRFKQADGSTTRRYGGLGLGLAIVRHIVELHGGQASASSAGPGTGAEFTITLPMRNNAPSIGADTPRLRPPRDTAVRPLTPSLAGLRVLAVDDEADTRELLQTVFSAAGATVKIAASSLEAFETFQRFQPHVLVSDIGMPGEDGYELIRRVRALDVALGGGVPALALTAYTRNEDRTQALALGFNQHVNKPFDPEALLSAVAALGLGSKSQT
jgi:PAS domain S-box-containing protein